ncbi:unnamed protein product [Meganyctiphanes norvegica]|uniref:Uncharacterized protein n=1 Tax=Meganyctiphanes norvegica TaxID=48144 RepID=A0AAV2S7K9_MEGNR
MSSRGPAQVNQVHKVDTGTGTQVVIDAVGQPGARRGSSGYRVLPRSSLTSSYGCQIEFSNNTNPAVFEYISQRNLTLWLWTTKPQTNFTMSFVLDGDRGTSGSVTFRTNAKDNSWRKATIIWPKPEYNFSIMTGGIVEWLHDGAWVKESSDLSGVQFHHKDQIMELHIISNTNMIWTTADPNTHELDDCPEKEKVMHVSLVILGYDKYNSDKPSKETRGTREAWIAAGIALLVVLVLASLLALFITLYCRRVRKQNDLEGEDNNLNLSEPIRYDST